MHGLFATLVLLAEGLFVGEHEQVRIVLVRTSSAAVIACALAGTDSEPAIATELRHDRWKSTDRAYTGTFSELLSQSLLPS